MYREVGQTLRSILTSFLLAILLTVSTVPALGDVGFGFLPERTYDGQRYQARSPSETTTILLIGYDHQSDGDVVELHGYSSGGQADFLLLVVLDHRTKEIRMLQIDRDTMAQVRVTDSNGNQHTRSSLQICLAHAYGDTREKNNANTVLAVETLLGIADPDDGAQIDWYVAMDISGISRLNDLLGGVTVTIESDLTEIDPSMTKGSVITLSGSQAEKFCRGRYGVDDQTNASRMVRQRQYISAAGVSLKNLIRSDANAGATLLDDMGIIYVRESSVDGAFGSARSTRQTPSGEVDGKYLMTNAMKKTIVNEMARAVQYEMRDAETLPGNHSIGSDGFIRYDIEEDAAIRWALDVFYRNK